MDVKDGIESGPPVVIACGASQGNISGPASPTLPGPIFIYIMIQHII